jgi:DNA mismatch endonuclease (patch repair protein)|tara:strand:- start:296 stop:736 length:441 start_codon:yes stop_codon:yes gene_type:complete
MVDRISEKKRSWNMSRIRSTNTKPEMTVRSLLHRNGFRFRLHQKRVYGKPDIVLKKYKTVIFIDGCFWHRHVGCKFSYTPKSNTKFWKKKFRDNKKRDDLVNTELAQSGWKVIRIWECEVAKLDILEQKLIQALDNEAIFDEFVTY